MWWLVRGFIALLIVSTVGFGCTEEIIRRCVNAQGVQVNCPDQATTGSATGGANTAAGGTEVGTTGGTSAGNTTGPSDVVTPPPVLSDSCEDRCGEYDGEAPCQCDEECFQNGDCCDDYFDECNETVPDEDTDDGGNSGEDYTFPKPIDTQALSYNDCRGWASGNDSWCDTYDCRGIVRWNMSYCTTADCKGIASANKSWCDSKDCKGIADGRLCEQQRDACMEDAEGSDAKAACTKTFDECVSDARSWCSSWHCRAIVSGDAGYCSSGGDNGNCRAIVKQDASYCFYDGTGE